MKTHPAAARGSFPAGLVFCAFLFGVPWHVSAAGSEKGSGYFSASYQFIHTDGFEATTGKLPVGTTDTHVLNLDFGYHLTDKWSASLGIPLIRKRYQGTVPHDPRVLDPPRDSEFIDDGSYHTNFQDWYLKVSYLARNHGRWRIEPFAALGVPSNDYPFYAASAVGQNLTEFEIGADITYMPPISDAWYRLEIGYVFVEETLGVSIDHWLVNAEAGYFFTPRWSGRMFMMLKKGDGLEFPDDFPPPRTGERWYQHDRMIKHNYLNVGVGANWSINGRYAMSLSALTTVDAEQVFPVEYAFTVGLAYSF